MSFELNTLVKNQRLCYLNYFYCGLLFMTFKEKI